MADPDDYFVNAFYDTTTFNMDADILGYDHNVPMLLDYMPLPTLEPQAPMASLPDTPNIRPIELNDTPPPLQLDVTAAAPMGVDLVELGSTLPPSQMNVEPVAPATMNPAPTAGALFSVILDSEVLNIIDINQDIMVKLALAVPHAEELRRIAAHQSSPNPENLQRLLTSSLLLVNAYATAASLLSLLVNRANRIAHILRLPEDVLLEILYIMAYTAPPAVMGWDGTNLGWLTLYWTCTDIRAFMKRQSKFWALVCTQLPRAHLSLRELAHFAPLTLNFCTLFPATPPAFDFAVSHDRDRALSILYTTPAFRFQSISCLDLRVCPSLILHWLATTGSTLRPHGLPYLRHLELEAPRRFDYSFAPETIDRFIKRPFSNFWLFTPALRTAKFINLVYPFYTAMLDALHLEFDKGLPTPECPRPTLSNIADLVRLSQGVIRELVLFNAISEEDDGRVVNVLAFSQLSHLLLVQDNSALIHLALSRFMIPASCNIRIETKYELSWSAMPQMRDLFYTLLSRLPHSGERLLRVRFLGVQGTSARTEISWLLDKDGEPIRYGPHSVTVVIETPTHVSWITCLRIFAETLVNLHHPLLKSLVLPVSYRAWELHAFHAVDAEIVRTLFSIGTVQYIWPPTRVTWALGSDAEWDIPETHPSLSDGSFNQYSQNMRFVQPFDMQRFH
ncbi:unnamed protein product [Peniophora sp. CBMAI 1063]|nr:unnamed protein product [Peniophora sp. CBMAI 1063]